MTIKEKAEELFLNMHNHDAKQCALIAVDEILNQVKEVAHEEIATPVTIYWLRVKQEIEEL